MSPHGRPKGESRSAQHEGTPVSAPSALPEPSPCISVCRMHEPTGWCEGCLRTLDEIAFWSVLDDDDRRMVHAELDRRRVLWGRLLAMQPPVGGPA